MIQVLLLRLLVNLTITLVDELDVWELKLLLLFFLVVCIQKEPIKICVTLVCVRSSISAI